MNRTAKYDQIRLFLPKYIQIQSFIFRLVDTNSKKMNQDSVAGFRQTVQTMGPRVSPTTHSYPACTVCGSGGARYHYHGLVCQSCRVFFIRTVGQNKPLICNRGGTCATVLGNSCNSCAACRYKKCLDAKMDISAVGRKKKPSTCVNVITNKNKIWREQFHEVLLPPSPQWIQQVSGASNIIDLAIQLVKMEMEINPLDNPTTSDVQQSGKGEYKLGRNSETLLKQKHPSSYYHQMAQDYMDNLAFYPVIKGMEQQDKQTLIEHNYQVMGLFSHKYYSWTAKKSFASAFMAVTPNIPPPIQAETVEDIFEYTQITDSEFVLLKIICLLSPAQNLTQEGHNSAYFARGQFVTILAELSRRQNLEYYSEHYQRITKLIDIIGKVKEQLTFETKNMANIDIPRLAQALKLSPIYAKYV